MTLKEQLRKERIEMLMDVIKACIPAFIIFAVFLVVFIYGNILKSQYDATIRDVELEMNELGITQAQNTARYQLLKQDEESIGVVVDETRQVTDDTVVTDFLNSTFAYNSVDSFGTVYTQSGDNGASELLVDLAFPIYFSNLESEDITSSASQSFSNLSSYLVSFSEDTYYYYAIVDGKRVLSDVVVDGDPYSESVDFKWLLSYGINGDGEIVDIVGYDVIK